jgi:hypothetical protein
MCRGVPCCACATSGHATTVPERKLTNSRRVMGFPHAEGYAGQAKQYHILGRELCLTSLPKRSLLMSEKGHKRT